MRISYLLWVAVMMRYTWRLWVVGSGSKKCDVMMNYWRAYGSSISKIVIFYLDSVSTTFDPLIATIRLPVICDPRPASITSHPHLAESPSHLTKAVQQCGGAVGWFWLVVVPWMAVLALPKAVPPSSPSSLKRFSKSVWALMKWSNQAF